MLTRYSGHFGDDFTGQMIQPTIAALVVSQPHQVPIPPGTADGKVKRRKSAKFFFNIHCVPK